MQPWNDLNLVREAAQLLAGRSAVSIRRVSRA
jgi:hypothetical protein